MKVLILGGTGAMGVHLVQLLANKGIKTFVTSRKDRCSTKQIQYIKGNAHDLDFLQTILKEHWDVIVDFMIYTIERFKERINLLLDATSQYIFLSSARVYADSVHQITETSPRLLNVSQDKEYLLTADYSLAKARQENLLINSGHKNWTIIRPYITYSENRLQLGVLEKEEWLYRAIHGRTIVFSKECCSKKTTLTYGLDVSKGIATIIGNPKVLGETFHITTKKQESRTWDEILDIYLSEIEKHIGHKPKILLQELDKFIEFRVKSKYQVLYDRLYNRVFDCSKVAQYINLDAFVKPEIGLKNCLNEFLKVPQFKYINWQMEAKRDRQTGERTPLKEINGIKQKIKYLFFRYFYISTLN